MRSPASARAGTADRPAAWAPTVAAGTRLPAAAGLGPASYCADLSVPHGRRHVRVRTATACFAAQGGRHLTGAERELGAAAGTASPDGGTSLQAVRCLGHCCAGPAALCSFHFPASGVNSLTSGHVDTVTSCPEYKVTAVRVGAP